MTELKYLMIIYAFTIIFLVAMQLLVPKLSRRGLILGVSIPEDSLNREEVRNEVAGFRRMTIILGLILILIMIAVVKIYPSNFWVHTIVLIGLSLFIFYPVYHFNKRLSKVKENIGIVDNPELVVIDTDFSRNKLTEFSSGLYLYWIPVIMILLASIYIIAEYDKYPNMIPIHYDFRGVADDFTDKSLKTIFTPIYTMLFLFMVMFLSNLMILKAKQRLDPKNPNLSLKRFIKARKFWTYYLVSVTILLILTILVPMIYTMRYNITEARFLLPITLIVTVFIISLSIVFSLKVGTVGERLAINESIDKIPASIGPEGEDRYWKLGGLIYNNPNDPSVFVTKRIGIGFTVNFGSLIGKLLLIGFLLLIVIMFWVLK